MAATLLGIRPILTIEDICDLLRISVPQFHVIKNELAAIGLLLPVYPELDRKRRYRGDPFVEWLSDKRQAAHLRDLLARVK